MRIYFSGLGGVGIGPLAEIARDAGHDVIGSDLAESPTTSELRAHGIEVAIGQDGSFLRAAHELAPLDWFVYTSALPEDHPELTLARELGIRTGKRDEFLAGLLREKDVKLVAVAGTHGKTSTTSQLVWTLRQLGIPVGYSIGTTVPFGPSGVFDPESEYFVYECDEYDRNFLQFHPHLAIIPSVDYDHPDTFPTEASYTEAFRTFLAQSAHAVLWRRDADFLGVTDGATILEPDEALPLSLSGEHNRRNGTLVLRALEHLGLGDPAANRAALETFPGVGRRFERLAENLYSDYGHHPVEIEATLELAREVADRVVLVYQPHQNQRQHLIRDQYTSQFERAERVYWVPTYLVREDPAQPVLTPVDLARAVTNRDAVIPAELDAELWERIQEERRAGGLVLVMGAGPIDDWVRERLAESQPGG